VVVLLERRRWLVSLVDWHASDRYNGAQL